MPDHDALRRQAERARGLDVRERALLERRAAHDAGVVGRREQDQERHGEVVAAAQDAHDDDRDEQARQRPHQVDPAHDRGVDQAALVAGEQAERIADQHGAERDQDRPDDGGAGADDRAREHVAAEVVGAQPELAARPGEADEQVLLVRIVRSDQVAEDREHGHDADHDEAQHDQDRDARAAPGAGDGQLRRWDHDLAHEAPRPKRTRGSTNR